MSNAFNAWVRHWSILESAVIMLPTILQWPIVFFPANEAPRWRKGMISIIVLAPIMVIITIAARIQQLEDLRRERRGSHGASEVEQIPAGDTKEEGQSN